MGVRCNPPDRGGVAPG